MKKIPLEIRLWWNDLGEAGQKKVNAYLGGITGLLKINPRGDIIKALISFWDPAHDVFHFSNFDLTPTLKEMTGYIRNHTIPLRHQYLIAPRALAVHKFLDVLKISRKIHNPDLSAGFCTLQFMYQRYGHIRRFNNPENLIFSKGNRLKWEEHRCFAFMVSFLHLLVFPRKDRHIDIRIVGVVYFDDSRKEYSCSNDPV